VLASRSNRAATTFGAVVDAGRPRSASSIYRLDASATRGALDLLALTLLGTQPTTATWHTRIRPGLTLQARPTRLRRRATSAVTFTVLDAGDPVRGARVRVGGQSGTANRQGRVTLQLVGRGRSLTASASAAGYVGATVRLRVSAR
jgi:hypothetical protein